MKIDFDFCFFVGLSAFILLIFLVDIYDKNMKIDFEFCFYVGLSAFGLLIVFVNMYDKKERIRAGHKEYVEQTFKTLF